MTRAGERIGATALYATQKSLAKIQNAISTNMSLNPTIRPVLDLSLVKADARQIDGFLNRPSLRLDNSVAYASQAQMAGYQASESAREVEFSDASRAGDVNFYQTNNSPKALTPAEIYRKTNNQLSVAKKELTTIDA